MPRLVAAAFFLAATANISLAGHITDGVFSPNEWSASSVSAKQVVSGGGAGGAMLYTDFAQTDHTLYFLFDYYSGSSKPSFFDLYFEVVQQGKSYLVRITPGPGNTATLDIYEKPIDGSGATLELGNGSPWQPIDSDDLLLANFRGAVGFGSSPGHDNEHAIAEFELSVNTCGTGGSTTPGSGATDPCAQPGGRNGLLSPSAIFWSIGGTGSDGGTGSGGDGPGFRNPDGDPNNNNVVDPNNNNGDGDQDPVLPTTAAPEPATQALLLTGLIALFWKAKTRRA
jgi:hypothetical protein